MPSRHGQSLPSPPLPLQSPVRYVRGRLSREPLKVLPRLLQPSRQLQSGQKQSVPNIHWYLISLLLAGFSDKLICIAQTILFLRHHNSPFSSFLFFFYSPPKVPPRGVKRTAAMLPFNELIWFQHLWVVRGIVKRLIEESGDIVSSALLLNEFRTLSLL